MPLTKDEINLMIKTAIETEKNAFLFKSKHAFGSAVLTTDGNIYGGCNIDGVISSQGSCAEVVALNNAVANGKYNIKAILVIDENEFVFPCGSCLQYLGQFFQTTNIDIEVVAAKENGEYKVKKLSQLLPTMYLSSSFDSKLKKYRNKK